MDARADPLPILRTFMTDRGLGADFHVDDDPPLAGDCSSFVLTEDRPLAWGAFSRAMETLVATRGPDLTQAKGLLRIEDCHGPIAIHYMQHLALPPVELSAWPDADRRSRVTFATRGITAAAVRRLFDAVRALA